MAIKLTNDRKWLERMAQGEDYGSVSAGGLLARALDDKERKQTGESGAKFLGRLVKVARCSKGMTVPELAEKAKLSREEKKALEEFVAVLPIAPPVLRRSPRGLRKRSTK